MTQPRPTLGQALDNVLATIEARRAAPTDQSYTAQLLAAGPTKTARKFGEEAIETVVATLSGSKADIVAETADLLFHLGVLLASRDIEPDDVAAELERRRAQSGLAEKAGRVTN